MFLGVSNYSLLPMEKTHFCILLFLLFITSLCNSNDYKNDNYKYYDEYNYDYNNQIPEDYTDDYKQELNDYYDHNILAPLNPPPQPPSLPLPPPTPMVPIGKITFFYLEYLLSMYDENEI